VWNLLGEIGGRWIVVVLRGCGLIASVDARKTIEEEVEGYCG